MATDDLSRIERWVTAGGTATVTDDGPPLVGSLRRCDGGEEVDRVVVGDPGVAAEVAALLVASGR